MHDVKARVLQEVESLRPEMVAFTQELVRIPTVNPPGDFYEDCARVIGARLQAGGFAVEYVAAEGRPEHTPKHPRLNVIAMSGLLEVHSTPESGQWDNVVLLQKPFAPEELLSEVHELVSVPRTPKLL
jgi:succinyl-diaminopimelate desuccinylase